MTAAGDLDVDARFLLANERTLLAWVRTALTLLVAGAGVQQFATDLPGSAPLALLLAATGVLSAVAGAVRHRAADRALRQGLLPATGSTPYLLSGVVVLAGTLLVVAVVLDA